MNPVSGAGGSAIEQVMALRKQINDNLKDDGVRVSVNDLIIKACVNTLKKHPKFQFERGKRLIVRLRKHSGLYIVTRVDIGYAFGAALQ